MLINAMHTVILHDTNNICKRSSICNGLVPKYGTLHNRTLYNITDNTDRFGCTSE